MKTIKIFTISVLAVLSMSLSAQIKVMNDGKVKIGGDAGNPGAKLEVRENNVTTEARLFATSPNIARLWAMNQIYSYGFGIDASGIGSIFYNVNNSNPAKIISFSDSWISSRNYQYTSFGTGRYNRFHQSNTGSYGGANGFDFNTHKSHGLIFENAYGEGSGMYFDSDYAVLWSPGDYDRLLRIYDEDGMVEKAYIDGNGYFHTNSDERRKKNIKEVNNARNTIKKLRGVEYNHKDSESISSFNSNSLENGKATEIINGHKVNRKDTIDSYKEESKLYYGFLAQELESVLPDVVSEDENGHKFVNYDAIIPILVEALKEMDTDLEQLKSKSKGNNKLKSASLNSGTTLDETLSTDAVLYQNIPNPFSENTDIKYFLPEDVKSATLYIYNMQGNQIKSIALFNRGEANETIYGSELQAGMYIYALIADGKEIDSKRMILTD
jgi:hypothetical protein